MQGLSESTKAVQEAFEQVSSINLIMEGFVLGYGLLLWMLLVLLPESYPDMVINLAVNVPQAAAVLAAGVLAVAIAPVFHRAKAPEDVHPRRAAGAGIGCI